MRSPRFALVLIAVSTIALGAASLSTPAVAQSDEAVAELSAEPAAAMSDLPRDEGLLAWMLTALGPFYSIAFLALSVSLVALLVMNLLSNRRECVVPESLIEGFQSRLVDRRYQDAYELAKEDESFLGRVLAAGLAKLSVGYERAVEAMQEVGEEESMKAEHRLGYLALVGTISPMVGLLGTVQGMIASFRVIAMMDQTPKPYVLAEGISTALFTTLCGLFIAIPAIAAHNIIRNRVARLVLEVGMLSDELMGRFSNVGRQAT